MTEARESANTAYDFAYVYNDGSAYFGTVVGGIRSGYKAGQILKNGSGYYQITSSQGASTAAIGTVNTTLYYDAISAATYVPALYSLGQPSGLQGLGSEQDTLSTHSGTTTAFGLGGVDKAALKLVLTYTFTFFYPDRSAYFGDAIDDGTYGYANGKVIKTKTGPTTTEALSMTVPTDITTSRQYPPLWSLSHQHLLAAGGWRAGTVHVSSYFDIGTGRFYTPVRYAEGKASSIGGLFSELDYISAGAGGLRSFGGPTHIEANTTNFGFSAQLTTATATATAFAFDGPIQGATVGYLDPTALPGTLSIDPTQPTATTNADGSYQLDAGTGPLVLTAAGGELPRHRKPAVLRQRHCRGAAPEFRHCG